MKVISVIGQKGGSGKSTVAVHLAVCAEQAGLSAAIIDTDPHSCRLQLTLLTAMSSNACSKHRFDN
jgi:cellulose biosynthesis protein BcsQ